MPTLLSQTRATLLRKLVPITGMLVLLGFTDVQAYHFKPTGSEYLGWSKQCQAAYGGSASGRENGYSEKGPQLDASWKALIWKIGAWHYCGGLIKIRRAELTANQQKREALFKEGIFDAMYSYTKIDKKHPWAAEMATTIARGYRGLGQIENAVKYLDAALKFHPNYSGTYTVYAMLFFDKKDYETAKKYLLSGYEVSQGNSSEIAYFLGLASVKLGQIAEAKKYAAEATQLGYPLKGLKEKIIELENAKHR